MFQQFLKGPVLKVIFIILVFLVVHNRWVVPRISFDQMRQMVALENIMQGHGVTYQFVGGKTESVFLDNSFPMGYYVLMAPFYHVFNDTLLLHRVFEIIGILILIWQLYLFGGWLETKTYLHGLRYAFLVFTLIQLNPWRASGFSDIWSLMLFLVAMRLVITKSVLTRFDIVAIGMLSFSTVFMRYAYYPLAFIPVLLMFGRSSRNQIRTYLPLAVLVLCILLMKGFDQWYFAGFDHLEAKHGDGRFFLSHLKQMEPIGFNAFFSDHVIFGALNRERWGVDTDWNLKYLILFVSGCILLFLFFKSYVRFNQSLISKNIKLKLFESGAWLAILINLGFISGISIFYPSKNPDYLYTWSLISRYFAPGFLFLQLLLIYSWISKDKLKYRLILHGLVISSFLFQATYLASFESRFSFTQSWNNYDQFYDRPEMPTVIAQYYHQSDAKTTISELHWTYEYLTFYYISKNDHYKTFITEECIPCLDFYSKKPGEETSTIE